MLHSIITHHPQWQIAFDAIFENSTPQYTAAKTKEYILNQYNKILYHNRLPDQHKLELITECYYELMTMTDLMIQNGKPFHALSIIVISLSYLPKIDDNTLSEDEVPQLIGHFGHSFNNLLKQCSPEERIQIAEQFQYFLNKLSPNDLYYEPMNKMLSNP
jgi:hypothetical protein